MYHAQQDHQPATANVQYNFLPHDSCQLYKKYARLHSIDISRPPECNIDAWLDPKHPDYKPELASSIFYYRARENIQERFRLCIQTAEMKHAAWHYGHHRQIILDGTFGICDRRLLLFITLGVDESGKGVPLAFFLFSAPTGNKATHAGYDTAILTELLNEWKNSLGTRHGEPFCPKVAITDTDTKERAALSVIWPSIWLQLCRFHLRQCWTNKRQALLKESKTFNFAKLQIKARLKALERQYVLCPQELDLWLTSPKVARI